jgi:predicted permease
VSIAATLLEIVAPVFLVVAAGYAAVRFRYLSDGIIDPLVKYTVSAAVPCLLFLAMMRVDLGQAVNPLALVSFFGASLLIFFAAMVLSRMVWRRRPGESVSVGFSAIFSNVVMLGIPISERAYGGDVTAAVFGIIAFHTPFNYFLGFIAMELIRRDGQTIGAALSKAATTTFKNPLMIGLLLGIAANLSGLALPEVMVSGLDMMAASAVPVALFSLGGVLTRYTLRDEVAEASMVSVMSLMIHPGLAWVLTSQVFGLPPEYVRAAVVLAAMPAGINGYIFATLYDRAVGTAANAVLIGTVMSVASISFWLTVLGA